MLVFDWLHPKSMVSSFDHFCDVVSVTPGFLMLTWIMILIHHAVIENIQDCRYCAYQLNLYKEFNKLRWQL